MARAALSPRIKAWALVGVLRGQLEQIPPAPPRYDGSLTVTVGDTVPGKDPVARPSPPPDPLVEYQQIVRAYEQSWYKLNDEAAQIRDPAERRRLYEEKRPRDEVTTVPLLQLAQRHPKERVAFKALAWIVEYARNTAQGETALTLLAQDHLAAKQLSRVCNMARLSRHAAAAEHLLRTVLANSPHRFVRGPACLALAEFLHDRAKVISSLRRVEHPVSAKVYEAHYGAEEMRRLQAADPEAVLKEAEACYERVLTDFADIHPPATRDSLAKRARAGLDEIRLLAVGKAAPEIKGEDIDGKPMRLSEFRGKVGRVRSGRRGAARACGIPARRPWSKDEGPAVRAAGRQRRPRPCQAARAADQRPAALALVVGRPARWGQGQPHRGGMERHRLADGLRSGPARRHPLPEPVRPGS